MALLAVRSARPMALDSSAASRTSTMLDGPIRARKPTPAPHVIAAAHARAVLGCYPDAVFGFGARAAQPVDFLPSAQARTFVAEGLELATAQLGAAAHAPRVITEAELAATPADPLDALFELLCGVQAQVGQADVEFTLFELGGPGVHVPDSHVPLGDPRGQLLHTFHDGDGHYLLAYTPALLRSKPLTLASVAREVGRIGLHRAGAGPHTATPADLDTAEADAELAAVALGLGTFVVNGAYLFENACCGGGCGIDLKGVRTGLSMPESAFALALDVVRKGLPRRSVARHLAATQAAAFRRSHAVVERARRSLGAAASPKALASATG
jgi:hypothetical protein